MGMRFGTVPRDAVSFICSYVSFAFSFISSYFLISNSNVVLAGEERK
jgi:hypothetical protein